MLYGVKHDTKMLKRSRKDLKDLYAQIPETKGCMEHITKPENEGGCGAWCCRDQTPQVLYVEFLNAWNNVSHNWKDDQIIELIERCLRSYLFPRKEKGCVFWNKDTKLCGHHEHRPYNCRVYGITPKEEFQPRYDRLKVLYPDTKPQCGLVSTVSGSEVTMKDTTQWWGSLNFIERSIGIKPELINDEQDGSYRNYHEHVLLHIIGEEGLESLTAIRLSDDLLLKENTIRDVMASIHNTKEKLVSNV